MNRMFSLLLVIMLVLSGCAGTSTIGNGKIDPVEEATIRLAVGAALSAMPAAAIPAYMVSTGLMAVIGTGDASLPGNIDVVIEKETSKLKMDQETKLVFADFLALVKAEVKQRLAGTGISENSRIVLIKQLVKIVNDVSRARVTPVSGALATGGSR
jgi:hypothetical protein